MLETSLLLDGGNIVSWAHKGLFEEKLKDDEAALASYSRSIELIEKSKPGTYSLELPFYAGVYQARAGVRERLGTPPGRGRIRSRSRSTEERSRDRTGGENSMSGSSDHDVRFATTDAPVLSGPSRAEPS